MYPRSLHMHKHLGLIFNEFLTWSDHVRYVSSHASRKLGLLQHLRKRLFPLVIQHLYCSSVRPAMEYASLAWSGLSASDAEQHAWFRTFLRCQTRLMTFYWQELDFSLCLIADISSRLYLLFVLFLVVVCHVTYSCFPTGYQLILRHAVSETLIVFVYPDPRKMCWRPHFCTYHFPFGTIFPQMLSPANLLEAFGPFFVAPSNYFSPALFYCFCCFDLSICFFFVWVFVFFLTL